VLLLLLLFLLHAACCMLLFLLHAACCCFCCCFCCMLHAAAHHNITLPLRTTTGAQLLPESYAALILAYMQLDPPDADAAAALFTALGGTGVSAQLPWAVLCRMLSSRGFAARAVAVVREGLAAGLSLDADVAEAYVRSLCDMGQSVSCLAGCGWLWMAVDGCGWLWMAVAHIKAKLLHTAAAAAAVSAATAVDTNTTAAIILLYC
jgi:hypothetical protein